MAVLMRKAAVSRAAGAGSSGGGGPVRHRKPPPMTLTVVKPPPAPGGMRLTVVAPPRPAPVTTVKKPKKAKPKPMSAKQYAQFLRYLRTHQNAKAKKKVAWSPDEEWPVCAARAVATWLELRSGPVLSDADVLALHWAAGGSRDGGTTLSDALSAARRLTLASFEIRPLTGSEPGSEAKLAGYLDEAVSGQRAESAEARDDEARHVAEVAEDLPDLGHALILGLDLPWGEPHAVVAHDGVWWSWGEPHDPWEDAAVTEVWAVAA